MSDPEADQPVLIASVDLDGWKRSDRTSFRAHRLGDLPLRVSAGFEPAYPVRKVN